MSTHTPILYTSATCGWAVRNYAACYEKSMAFEAVDIKSAGPAAMAAFRVQFPYAKTPALAHGHVRVWESLLINHYIDEVFPGPALLPESAAERSAARLWMHHCDNVLFPAMFRAVRPHEPQGRALSTRQLQAGIAELEQIPRPWRAFDPWWSGSAIGLVDFCYQVFFDALAVTQDEMGTFAVELPDWMRDWSQAVAGAPSVERARALVASLQAQRRAEPV